MNLNYMTAMVCVYVINFSKLELEKVIDQLQADNQALQSEVDLTSDFVLQSDSKNSLLANFNQENKSHLKLTK